MPFFSRPDRPKPIRAPVPIDENTTGTLTMAWYESVEAVVRLGYPMGWKEAMKLSTMLTGAREKAVNSQNARPFVTTRASLHSPLMHCGPMVVTMNPFASCHRFRDASMEVERSWRSGQRRLRMHCSG